MSNVRVENPEVDFSRFQLLHEVFRHRAADPVQTSLMAFPKLGFADFEYFTGKALDQFTDTAAWRYSKANLRTTELNRVALLGPTNLDWVVSVFGLSRAGYTVLTLSPRLSAPAIVKLMQETHCECLIYHALPQLVAVVEEAASLLSVQTLPILCRRDYDTPRDLAPPFERDVDVAEERRRPATIVHSSGSTGLPKPIEVGHARYTMAYAVGPGDRDLMTLPLYHSFALQVCPGRMYQRKTVFFLNPHLPLTCEGLTVAIQEAEPGTLCAVPYVLKLLAEQESGTNALKQIGQVMFTGSPCPDDLGDRLVKEGVNLASFMGTSECGFVGASIGRPADDKAWNYLRPPPPLMKHIYPKPIAADTFEFVFLKDHPGRLISNSDDPPESFHSRDIFTPHKTIPSAWKYLGRLDDRVTLTNGEKVLPLPIEGSIRQHKLVKEAVVFGIGRAIPGLLILRSQAAKDLGDKDFIDVIWPTVEAANRVAEGFSQIGMDMIVPIPVGLSIPLTDKGSIIRAQVYNVFEKEIEEAYVRIEQRQGGTMIVDGTELEMHLLKLGQDILGPRLSDPKDDLFALGMNSLQAIQMRGSILRDLYLGGNGRKLSQNLVLENGNVANLARHLEAVRSSQDVVHEKPIAMMKDLIAKFSAFEKHTPGADNTSGTHTVVLTGATGALGAHILSLLLNQPSISMICCLIRGVDPLPRLLNSFKQKRLPPIKSSKLRILASDLHDPHLGLSHVDYTTLISSTTHIIHCAWPVNFQLGLASFIPSLQGLQNLIQLSLFSTLLTPARLIFCSSVSAALGTPAPALIPEAPIHSLEQISQTGYAASKLVGERIVQAAVEDHGASATILRIGQVVGDTKAGVWNDTEALPLIIRSAVTMGVLPDMDMTCRWLPVDTLAESVLEIAGLRDGAAGAVNEKEGQLVYNVLSPHTFSWMPEFCRALHATELSAFEIIPFKNWLARLRSLSVATTSFTNDKMREAADPNRNPAIKLVDFFAVNFAENNTGSGILFETSVAEKASSTLRSAPKVIESGLLGKMVEVWMKNWTGKGNV